MGWRLVPEEPTQEMVRAAYQAQPDAINAGFAQAYRNMLAEAPKPAGDIAAPVDADLVARCKEVLARQPGAALAAYSAKLAAVFGDKYASLADAAAVNSTQVEAMRELVRIAARGEIK